MEPLFLKSHVLIFRNQFEITEGHQPQNALFVVESGSFSCSFQNGETFIAKNNDVIFFPLKSRFKRQVINPVSIQLMYFNPNTENPLSSKLPHGVLKIKDEQRKDSDILLLRQLLRRTDDIAWQTKQHIINDLFLMYCLDNDSPEEETNLLSPRVRKVTQLIEKNIKENFSLKELSAVASCSESTLIRLFQNETGKTPLEYIINLRMTAAKHLLSSSDQSIGNISAECGYENIYYFSNTFRKHVGCTPSEYRESSKESV